MKHILFFQIETTEDKDDLIVADKQKMSISIENAETPKEGKNKISILPLFKR